MDGLLPVDFSFGTADGNDREFLPVGDGQVVVSSLAAAVGRIELLAYGNRRRQVEAISPDDRCGVAVAGDRELPPDVFIWAPLNGRIGSRAFAGVERASPTRPVGFGRGGLGGEHRLAERQENEKTNETCASWTPHADGGCA